MWFLDYRVRDVGGPVATTPRLFEGAQFRGHGLSALPRPAEGVTFVFHGFNNDRKEGVSQTEGFVEAAIDQVPSLARTVFVGVLWPGDAIVGFLSYPTEESDADRTAARLAKVLREAPISPPPNMIAHSLGCRVLLRTVEILARQDPDRRWVDQIVLLAGAVDDDVLARKDRYAQGARNAARLVNVASTADQVLRFAFPAGDWFAAVFSKGYTRTAIGRGGPSASPPPPASVRPFQVGSLDVGHGDYLGGKKPLGIRAAAFAGRVLERREPLHY